MADTQSAEQRRALKHGALESQLIGVDTMPLVKRLDGEVTKQGDLAFAGGTYSETWKGEWKKGGGEKSIREETYEIVSRISLPSYVADMALCRLR